MKIEYLKNKWRKLDNVAKVFSLDKKGTTNIFRYSVLLKQKVNKFILKKALDKALNNYNAFKVKIGTGVFWNYLEYNPKEPIITKESEIPCQYINFKENNDYLFKITYYKNKINLDVFHILTDGVGITNFLKSIIYNYLSLKHNIPLDNNIKTNIGYEDQYLKKYDKTKKTKNEFKLAYQIKEKINKNINNTYHYIVDLDSLKEICKNYNATITEYLTAIYIYAIYLSIYNKNSKKEITLNIPIDLRKVYQVDTLSNFFVCTNINSKIVENKLKTFEEILNQIKKEFKEKINKDKIKEYLTRDVKLGLNLGIRIVPLPIKKLFMKFIIDISKKTSTSTVSNVGIIDIDDKYKRYIDNILVLVMPNINEKITCTVCSYNKKLNITINSIIKNNKIEQTFLKLLQEQIKNIKLETNTISI